MRLVNFELFEASIEKRTPKTGDDITVLNLGTNGPSIIGEYRLPKKFDDHIGALDLSEGLDSLDDIGFEAIYTPVACVSVKNKNGQSKIRLSSKADDVEANSDKEVWCIAIPFKKRISEITMSPNIEVLKTCFTSVKQVGGEPFNFLTGSGYTKTLYILATVARGVKESRNIITVCETSMNMDVANDVLNALKSGKGSKVIKVAQHLISVELPILKDNDYHVDPAEFAVIKESRQVKDWEAAARAVINKGIAYGKWEN